MRKLLLGTVYSSVIILSGCTSTVAPITDEEASHFAIESRNEILTRQAPITQSISLYEAMARALKHNLDHRVVMMEADLAKADHDLSRWDLLPKVVANGQYYGRSNEAGARSLSLLSGRESLEPSTSTERDVFTGDLTASWNILDFGLSKIRAEQLGNEAHIQEERRRKAIIEIMEDVHRSYYRAISAERLSSRLAELEGEVGEAFQTSRQDIQGEAKRLARDMQMSKMELASLMGLAPDQRYNLQIPEHMPRPAKLNLSYEEMIDQALRNRPEMRESLYAQRIGEKEIKKATLEALPSLEGFAGIDASSNDFLFNNDWASYGARASWNLLKVFNTGERKRKAKARVELERERGLATAMAVMTQVGVARTRYQSLTEEYLTARDGAMVQNDILNQVEALSRASSTSKQTLVRERMNTILSEARRDAIMAEMTEASAHIYTAIGYDPYSSDIDGTEDIQTIAENLKTLWTERSKVPGE